jgi:hypothetical protein
MKYHYLEEGEIIQKGDEVAFCNDGWRDDPKWMKATCIGDPAPDPRFFSHRTYRRKVKK